MPSTRIFQPSFNDYESNNRCGDPVQRNGNALGYQGKEDQSGGEHIGLMLNAISYKAGRSRLLSHPNLKVAE